MEYQNKDFDVNRPVQYQEIRREIGTFVCDIEIKTKTLENYIIKNDHEKTM